MGIITKEVADKALTQLEVDQIGLDEIDHKILHTIIDKFNGGPVGLETIAASISEESDTIMDVYEPYLLQLAFLERTPRGRVATERAYQHLGIPYPKKQPQNQPLCGEKDIVSVGGIACPVPHTPDGQKDIPQVTEIDREAFPLCGRRSTFNHELNNRLAHYVVAADGDKMIENPTPTIKLVPVRRFWVLNGLLTQIRPVTSPPRRKLSNISLGLSACG